MLHVMVRHHFIRQAGIRQMTSTSLIRTDGRFGSIGGSILLLGPIIITTAVTSDLANYRASATASSGVVFWG